MNSVIYDLLFRFRKKYSTSHLIHLTNKIREQLGSVNFVCRTFADFKNQILTVHHSADDTHLLNHKNSMKRMNKQVEEGLQNLTN